MKSDSLYTEVRQNVKEVALMMDKDVPGWAGFVTKPIQMLSIDNCPLGQVYGDWRVGLVRLGLYGTHYTVPASYSANAKPYWEKEIARRCKAQ